jgi:hypothetical protein
MTFGIMFFGTPHKGSSAADLAGVLAQIVNFACLGNSIYGRMRTDLLKSLSRDSSLLEKVSTSFRTRATKLRIVSFFEGEVTPPLAHPVGVALQIFIRESELL